MEAQPSLSSGLSFCAGVADLVETYTQQVHVAPKVRCMRFIALISLTSPSSLMPTTSLNVQTRFGCPQAFLNLDFQCRDDIWGLK